MAIGRFVPALGKFVTQHGGRLVRPVGTLAARLGSGRAGRLLQRFKNLRERPGWKKVAGRTEITSGFGAAGLSLGFAEWERRRIKQANLERDTAVRKFRQRLEKYEPPARRKKVPRLKKSS